MMIVIVIVIVIVIAIVIIISMEMITIIVTAANPPHIRQLAKEWWWDLKPDTPAVHLQIII